MNKIGKIVISCALGTALLGGGCVAGGVALEHNVSQQKIADAKQEGYDNGFTDGMQSAGQDSPKPQPEPIDFSILGDVGGVKSALTIPNNMGYVFTFTNKEGVYLFKNKTNTFEKIADEATTTLRWDSVDKNVVFSSGKKLFYIDTEAQTYKIIFEPEQDISTLGTIKNAGNVLFGNMLMQDRSMIAFAVDTKSGQAKKIAESSSTFNFFSSSKYILVNSNADIYYLALDDLTVETVTNEVEKVAIYQYNDFFLMKDTQNNEWLKFVEQGKYFQKLRYLDTPIVATSYKFIEEGFYLYPGTSKGAAYFIDFETDTITEISKEAESYAFSSLDNCLFKEDGSHKFFSKETKTTTKLAGEIYSKQEVNGKTYYSVKDVTDKIYSINEKTGETKEFDIQNPGATKLTLELETMAPDSDDFLMSIGQPNKYVLYYLNLPKNEMTLIHEYRAKYGHTASQDKSKCFIIDTDASSNVNCWMFDIGTKQASKIDTDGLTINAISKNFLNLEEGSFMWDNSRKLYWIEFEASKVYECGTLGSSTVSLDSSDENEIIIKSGVNRYRFDKETRKLIFISNERYVKGAA